MKINKHVFVLLLFFIAYFIGYALLIPTYENPDEYRHYWAIFNDDNFYSLKGNGGLYNYYMKGVANMFDLSYRDSYSFNEMMKNANVNFHFFANEYRFKHDSIFPRKDVLICRMANLIVLLPLLKWFLNNSENRKLLAIALVFPGFMWFVTALNPDLFNIIFSIIIFKYYYKPKWLLVFLCFLGFIFLDRSIILLFLALIVNFTYQKTVKTNVSKVIFWFLFIFSLIVAFNFSKSIISYDYKYEPIKSIFTAIVSFYGLLGNMSIRATFLEYFIIFFVILLIIFKRLILSKSNPNYNKIKDYMNLITIFIVLWLYLMILVPTLDQGRYFYPIIFYFLYVLNDLVLKNRIKKISSFIILSLITNGIMYFKLICIYFTQ